MAGGTEEGSDARVGHPMTHSCEKHAEPSRRCYCVCGCRCVECREHQRLYAAQHSRDKAYGRPRRVDAAPVLARIEQARQAGIGWKRLADTAGVSRSALWKVIAGESRTVSVRTAKAIMGVRIDLADGAYIPAGQYVDALNILYRKGWKKRDLGVWITGDPRTISLQVKGPNIKVGTAKRIVELVNLIDADRVKCVTCGVPLRKAVLCGGCRVRQHVSP